MIEDRAGIATHMFAPTPPTFKISLDIIKTNSKVNLMIGRRGHLTLQCMRLNVTNYSFLQILFRKLIPSNQIKSTNMLQNTKEMQNSPQMQIIMINSSVSHKSPHNGGVNVGIQYKGDNCVKILKKSVVSISSFRSMQYEFY